MGLSAEPAPEPPPPPTQPPPPPPPTQPPTQPPADPALIVALYRAQTERMQLLVNFLSTPVLAPLGEDGRYDPDVEAAYNVATERTLKHISAMIMKEH